MVGMRKVAARPTRADLRLACPLSLLNIPSDRENTVQTDCDVC